MYVRRVTPKLFQGSRPSFNTLRRLKKDGVTVVIDVGYSRLRDMPVKVRERLYCLLLGLKYRKRTSCIIKSLPSKDYFEKISKEVEHNRGATFIHCRSGKRRTNFVIKAIEILQGNKTPNQAVEEIKAGGYFVFNEKTLRKIRKKRGIISEESIKANLAQRLEEFKKMFSKTA